MRNNIVLANSVLVSFIIPVHNGERTLKACLDSVLQQEHPDFDIEIIVVNNNSTDRSQEVAEQFSEVVILFQGDLSRAKARQRGLAEAKGDLIAFVDCDVILEKNWSRVLVNHLKKFPQTGGVQAPIIPLVEKTWHWLRWKRTQVKTLGTFIHLAAAISGTIPVINTAASLWRRKSLRKGFDEKLARAEDMDLTMSVLRSGYSLAGVVKTKAYVRWSSGVVSWFKRFYEQGLYEENVFFKYSYSYPEIHFSSLFRNPLFAGRTILLLIEMIIMFLFKSGLRHSSRICSPTNQKIVNHPPFMYQSFKEDRYFLAPECRSLTVGDKVGILNLLTKKCIWVPWDESQWSGKLEGVLLANGWLHPRFFQHQKSECFGKIL